MHRIVTLWLVGLAIAASAQAEPHYSALFGQSCFLCHANPTGRAMRSLYGSQFFGPTYLPALPVSDAVVEKLKPQLSESVTIGADLRTLWASENTQDKTKEAGLSAPLSTNTGTISEMEGYIYLSLQPSDQFLIYYSQGIAQSSGRFEAYGLASVLPFHGFVKAGQFQENYGWVLADHTSYVRTGLFEGYDGKEGTPRTPPEYGVGGEIGFRPWIFDVTASFTNAQTSIPVARDAQKRWFARAQMQRGIERLGLQFTGGASWFDAPYRAADPEIPYSVDMKRYEGWGGFGAIGWQGLSDRLRCKGGFGFLATSLLFEYDRKAWTPQSEPVTSAYSTTQVSVMVQPGVWLYGAYDWLNNGLPDSTHPEAERTALGLQVYPLPWVEISPRYRLESLAGEVARNKQVMEVQAHFFF